MITVNFEEVDVIN